MNTDILKNKYFIKKMVQSKKSTLLNTDLKTTKWFPIKKKGRPDFRCVRPVIANSHHFLRVNTQMYILKKQKKYKKHENLYAALLRWRNSDTILTKNKFANMQNNTYL